MSEEAYSEVKKLEEKLKSWGEILESVYGFNMHLIPFQRKDFEPYKRMYKTYKIPKSHGFRRIDAPDKTLKAIQQEILMTVIYPYMRPPDVCHSYMRNESVITNAMFHIGKEYVFQTDIKDFFYNVKYEAVENFYLNVLKSMLQLRENGGTIENILGTAEAYYLVTGLTNISVYMEKPSVSKTPFGFLPQGSPTSPAISNFMLPTTDTVMRLFAEKWSELDVAYTRYSDNITVSWNDGSYGFDGNELKKELYRHLMAGIKKDGFNINRRKTRLKVGHQRKVVTGISVSSDHMNVPRAKYRRYRAIVHNISMKSQPTFKDYMKAHGIAEWVRNVNPDKYPYFDRKLDVIRSKLNE